jgi:hypothetical protein
MKKVLIIICGLLCLPAFAEVNVKSVYVGGETGFVKFTSGTSLNKTSSSQSLAANVLYTNNMTLDLRAVTQQQDTNGTANYGNPLSYQEIGLGQRYSIGLTNVYGKAYLQEWEKPLKRYTGYAGEIGVTDKILNSNFSYTVSYKQFNSFENSAVNTAKNNQMRYSLAYNINDNHRISLKKQDQRGYTQYDGIYVGYSYKFK